MDQTLKYYQNNFEEFFNSTVSADMSDLYFRFLTRIPKNSTILDFGCGSGRDSLYFKKNGFTVAALDGSSNLAKKAEKLINQKVYVMDFRDYTASKEFDGIWACASLLHLREKELEKVLKELYRSLSKNGVIYISFKYGEYEGVRNKRYFHDWTEDSFNSFLNQTNLFKIDDKWITKDVRPDKSERWLNLLLSKNEEKIY